MLGPWGEARTREEGKTEQPCRGPCRIRGRAGAQACRQLGGWGVWVTVQQEEPCTERQHSLALFTPVSTCRVCKSVSLRESV